MSCDSPYERISAYVDGELDAAAVAQLEQHLRGCEDCRRAAENARVLRHGILAAGLRVGADPDTRDRLRSALRSASRQSVAAPQRVAAFTPSVAGPRWTQLWALAATVAFVALGAFNLGGWWSTRGPAEPAAEAVVSSHMRSLLGEHLLDVPSSDRHTVKPWFSGKLEFAPRVLDLAEAGFPLQGGRLDVIEGKRVAALVYQADKHVINLFVRRSMERPGLFVRPLPQESGTLDGYGFERWQDEGLEYWAVSDVDRPRLQEFARRWHDRAGVS